MGIDIPTREGFVELSQQRNDGSVSLYLGSGAGDSSPPIGRDSDVARLALRSAATAALAQLTKIDLDSAERQKISESLESLDNDRDFWETPARSIAVFVSPENMRAFRLRNELPNHTAVGDRFDIGPLLRATSFTHSGYVLAVTEGDVRLLALHPDASIHLVDLPNLPADVAETLETTDTDGRFDRRRATGALGPKVEQRRYCSAVQDAVLDRIGDSALPLVLAASSDLEAAYREVNSYRGLLEHGIAANPSSLSASDLEKRGREAVKKHFDDELASWRESFGTMRANGHASSQLTDVARAASAGLVDTLLFDLASVEEGSIDESGAVTFAAEPSPTTYGLVDEIAVRVLRTGGTVRAVRLEDLPDDKPVAAIFRGAL
ncbi:baeRF11 domain-containing protein [Salinibacterium sp. PAMC 21357]|uniref:baeRF11 domain-containing protein n=1 Tax=Salinibacterium sp. PAMC 21357 TaxID=1112215 RepID=UPI000287BFB0|nr:hypothetical protein [Salinibacterium sp. PAMC 21357]